MEVAVRNAPVLTSTPNPMFPRIAVKTSYNTDTAVFSLLVLALVGFTSGCHRQFYRKQADQEAHALILEKSNQINRPSQRPVRIDLDRRSRMFNPFDLDFQPMPLDDPASHRFMQCVDGRRGYPMWHAAGVTNTVESPDWWQFLPLDDDGVLVLNAETAVQIALLHSPNYQRQLEQLYLSALDVSSERFELDTQFFGGASLWNTATADTKSAASAQTSETAAQTTESAQADTEHTATSLNLAFDATPNRDVQKEAAAVSFKRTYVGQ